jgi:hypothetical protein
VSPSGSIKVGRLSGGPKAHDFDSALRGAPDSTHATRGPSIYDYNRTTSGSSALLASPLGCARATVTASTSAVAVDEGCTSGTSDQSSSNDHAGEAGLLSSG